MNTRTFTAGGKTFTTKAKARYALVLTTNNGWWIYCHDRDYRIGSKDGSAFVAKSSNNRATLARALDRFKVLPEFASATIVDTYTEEGIR